MIREQSVWLDVDAGPRLPPLRGRVDADVAVVGGGITGLSTACHLRARHPELEVVVLEADRVGSGASGRSSGALTTVPERRFALKLARDGLDETRRAAAFQRAGVETALELAGAGTVDCVLGPTGYLILGRDDDADALRQEADAMTRVGIEGRLLDRDEVSALVRSPFWTVGVTGPAHRIDPAAYTRGLARLAQAWGARVFEGSPVRAVRRGSPSRLRVPGGEVRATTVVLAANAWTPHLGFLRRRVFTLHTCAVATEPITGAALDSVGWKGRQVVFELARQGPTSYLTPDDRLVCRGLLRYRFGDGLRPPDLGRAEALLTRAVVERFPQLAPVRISHRWSGVLDMTRSLHPFIGCLPGPGAVLCAAGYCGHGLAAASLAGRLLAELHDGERSPELDYALEHPPPKMPPEPLRWLALRALAR